MSADLTRGGRIADPVHGYVDFTGIERRILDHPVAQRLRHILQNGLAYLVFPEAVTSRFSHSLGAMLSGGRSQGFEQCVSELRHGRHDRKERGRQSSFLSFELPKPTIWESDVRPATSRL
jgi:hypothetical protein